MAARSASIRKQLLGGVCVATLALGACQSAAPAYRAASAPGDVGFFSVPADAGRHAVTYTGEKGLSPAQVAEYALLRAAELTLASGQQWFAVLQTTSRQVQIGEVLRLGSAEVTFGMLKESLRGMALGLHLSKDDGLTVPWEEIDAVVGKELAGMEESLRDASLGTLAYALSPLSDAELAGYLDFLRAPGTQKFQAVTALTIGRAIHDAMGTLGTGLAARLAAVAI